MRDFTDFGRFGVQLFFIISGLLAARGLDGKNDTWGYYKKRLIAIAPLYYVVIIWYFITENLLNIFFHHIPVDAAGLGWFRYVFMLNGFVNSDTYFWSNLGITWTIPIFAFFYLIAPFVMRVTKDWKSGACIFGVVFIGTRILCHFYSCTIFQNIHYFFIGIIIYFCWRDNKLMPCALSFLIIAIAEIILERLSYPAIFAAMICIGLEHEVILSEKMQRVVDVIDEHSYTMYLVHGIVFCSLLDRLRADRFGVPRVIIGVIAIVGTFLGSVIVHRWIEKPLQQWVKKRLLTKNSAPT